MNCKKYDAGDGEYGRTGEARFRQYILSSGYQAIHHPNGKYGPDVEYESDSERFYVDIERATSRRWHGDAWLRYQTLHVLARRKITPGTMIVTMSADMSRAYVSFPDDLLRVNPEPMTNRHVESESIRNHEIMRCLPLDLSCPVDGSLAHMNVRRVRQLAAQGNYDHAIRALRGRCPFSFGPPYGMDPDEWSMLILSVEGRTGLTKHVHRASASAADRQPSLFEKSTQFWS